MMRARKLLEEIVEQPDLASAILIVLPVDLHAAVSGVVGCVWLQA